LNSEYDHDQILARVFVYRSFKFMENYGCCVHLRKIPPRLKRGSHLQNVISRSIRE